MLKGKGNPMEGNYRETVLTKLRNMRNSSVKSINADDVREYSEISVDMNSDPQSRVLALIEQTGNPYVYRDGGVLIKLSFSESGRTLQSCLEDYLTSEVLLNKY